MKKIIIFILLFVCLASFSQKEKVEAVVDTTNIRIGEQFIYKIFVDANKNVIIPNLNLKKIEIVDSLKTDTIKRKIIKKYILTCFDSGAFYIPQQQIFIKNQVYLTDSILVYVASVAVDTTKIKKFPIKGIRSESIRFSDYKNIILWIIIILIFVITVLYFALKRTPDDKAISYKLILSPYQEARNNLKLLDEKLLWQNNKVKEYYSELTQILRHYIQRELNIPALEITTNDLIEKLYNFKQKKEIISDKETINILNKLLKQADLVKFAKLKPINHKIEGDRNITEYIINNIKPNIKENQLELKTTQPIILVQKPKIKKNNLLKKIILILSLIVLSYIVAFIILKSINMFNSLNIYN